jgi:hypothetical protein
MKTLKFYEAPEVEIVDIEIENQILAGSTQGNAEGITEDPIIIDPSDQD